MVEGASKVSRDRLYLAAVRSVSAEVFSFLSTSAVTLVGKVAVLYVGA